MTAFKGSVMSPSPGRNPFQIGEISGFPVGYKWTGRRQLCDSGVHAYLMRGIHGRSHEGAFSIVISGGYDDDLDLGDIVYYTGEGGQASRNTETKAWAKPIQIKDQSWKGGNKALKRSYETGKPVRVIRGCALRSVFAPPEGYRYDGLYIVTKAELVHSEKHEFAICKFTFQRCPGQPLIPRQIDQTTTNNDSSVSLHEEESLPGVNNFRQERLECTYKGAEEEEFEKNYATSSPISTIGLSRWSVFSPQTEVEIKPKLKYEDKHTYDTPTI